MAGILALINDIRESLARMSTARESPRPIQGQDRSPDDGGAAVPTRSQTWSQTDERP
jgi:hypothetical protein